MSDDEFDDQRVVRPFIVTGGRTTTKLPPEAVVVTAVPLSSPAVQALNTEARQILDVTRKPCAVIEIAAELSLPIQVTMVLVGDLTDRGVLHVYRYAGADHDPALLERLIYGINRL